MIKTREEIEKQIIAETVANQNEVTVFEPKTVIRGLITAFAGTIRELWNDFYREVRKRYRNTSTGKDLDELNGETGILRKGAVKAGVLITFKGTAGTVIPLGTVCTNPSTGLGYATKNAITLGQINPGLLVSNINNLEAPSISDTVWAECQTAGSIGNSQVNTITGKPSITGVSSCTNPSPAQGGADIEDDSSFRERGRNYISVLNQGTPAAYEAWCRLIEPTVLRVKSGKDRSAYDTVKLILVNENASNYSAEQLKFIAAEVENRNRAYTKIVCENMAFSFITVKARIRLKSGNTLEEVFVRTADALAEYFNWKIWEFGGEISIDDVFRVCNDIRGVEDTELNTFFINATNPKTASISQTLYTQVSTSATTSTITDTGASFEPDALIGKFVKIASGNGIGQVRQIVGNTATEITILGTWEAVPADGSTYLVVELYILSARTKLALSGDSLPYFMGLELTDISNPQVPVHKRVGNIRQIQQQQNQNQE